MLIYFDGLLLYPIFRAHNVNDRRFPIPVTSNADPYVARSSAGVDLDQRFLCLCGESPVERTVKKAGQNQGRKFYVCAQPRDSQCNFFAWSTNPSETARGVDQSNFGTFLIVFRIKTDVRHLFTYLE